MLYGPPMPIDYDAIQAILGKLTAEEREVIAGQMKARALTKPKATPANRYAETVTANDGKTQITFTIGRQKGNVRVYGLDRKRPVALFGHQWLQLLQVSTQLYNFILKHQERLKDKS